MMVVGSKACPCARVHSLSRACWQHRWPRPAQGKRATPRRWPRRQSNPDCLSPATQRDSPPAFPRSIRTPRIARCCLTSRCPKPRKIRPARGLAPQAARPSMVNTAMDDGASAGKSGGSRVRTAGRPDRLMRWHLVRKPPSAGRETSSSARCGPIATMRRGGSWRPGMWSVRMCCRKRALPGWCPRAACCTARDMTARGA